MLSHKEGVINLSKKNKDEKKPSRKAVNKLSELGTEMAEIWNGYNDTTNSDVLGSYTGNHAARAGFRRPLKKSLQTVYIYGIITQ